MCSNKMKILATKIFEVWAFSVLPVSFFGVGGIFSFNFVFDLYILLAKGRHDLITCTVYICRKLDLQDI